MTKKKPPKQPFAAIVTSLGERRVAIAASPGTAKKPATGVPTTWNDEYPSWRVGQLQVAAGDPFTWNDLSAEKLLEIRAQLASFESMTWNQISVEGKYHNHSIPVNRLIPQAQRRLRDMGLGSYDDLFRFRIGNLPRIWGFRDRHVMHLLWWDPEHLICPSGR